MVIEEEDESFEDANETAEESPPTSVASASGENPIMEILSSNSSGGNSTGNCGGLVDDPSEEKRKAIQTITRDTALSPTEKNHRVQKLMDGRMTAELAGAAGRPPNADISEAALNCSHYEWKCCIVAPCCGEVFGCRFCHEELAPHPGYAMDRYAVREVACKGCRTRQPTSNKCIHCGVQFADYHCATCKIWTALDKEPFHCEDCGFCRVGGREAFKHCPICCMCISITVFQSHDCIRDKYKNNNNCPVCTEDLLSSPQAPMDLPCGHAIHAHCFCELSGSNYLCPVCKKTVVSHASMAATWSARARDITMNPMPPDLARVIDIMCNDCETESKNCNFHFLGVQCLNCSSFNTQVHSSSDDNNVQFPQSCSNRESCPIASRL